MKSAKIRKILRSKYTTKSVREVPSRRKPEDYVIATGIQYSIRRFVEIVAKKIGVSEVVKGGGYRSLVNVGENGGQEVPHLHFHIFGGEKIGKMVT